MYPYCPPHITKPKVRSGRGRMPEVRLPHREEGSVGVQ